MGMSSRGFQIIKKENSSVVLIPLFTRSNNKSNIYKTGFCSKKSGFSRTKKQF